MKKSTPSRLLLTYTAAGTLPLLYMTIAPAQGWDVLSHWATSAILIYDQGVFSAQAWAHRHPPLNSALLYLSAIPLSDYIRMTGLIMLGLTLCCIWLAVALLPKPNQMTQAVALMYIMGCPLVVNTLTIWGYAEAVQLSLALLYFHACYRFLISRDNRILLMAVSSGALLALSKNTGIICAVIGVVSVALALLLEKGKAIRTMFSLLIIASALLCLTGYICYATRLDLLAEISSVLGRPFGITHAPPSVSIQALAHAMLVNGSFNLSTIIVLVTTALSMNHLAADAEGRFILITIAQVIIVYIGGLFVIDYWLAHATKGGDTLFSRQLMVMFIPVTTLLLGRLFHPKGLAR